MGAGNVMRVLPNEMYAAANDFGRLSDEARHVQRRLQRSWQRLDYGWQSYARQDVDGAYVRAMRELNRMAEMSGQIQAALQMTVDGINTADQESTLLFLDLRLKGAMSLFSGMRGKAPTDLSVEDGVLALVGAYKLGAPEHPDIQHDNGFLDEGTPRKPTLDDWLSYSKWSAALEAMKLENRAGRNNLDDGISAYDHFLHGNGSDKTFSYAEYVQEDSAGAETLENILLDAQNVAEEFMHTAPDGKISVTSEPFTAGGDDPRFPYPQTENWQKAIGAHPFWTSADIQVETSSSGQRVYTMVLTVHAEDRYNFNPGMTDIVTGTLDAVNGQFELCGLGKQYMHYGEATYTVTWNEGEPLDLSQLIPTDFPVENSSEVMEWGQEMQNNLNGR